MPANYARFLLNRERTVSANRQLGWALAFVAGAMNAGGFLAVQQYTSHVTGSLSMLADQLALGQMGLVVDATVSVLAFLVGAVVSSVLILEARRRRLASEYALPLLLEAALILLFGLAGSQLSRYEGLLVPFTVVLLCFMMGLQNAVVTKLSGAVIRTTHMTGVVTDLGIEIGRALHSRRTRPDGGVPVRTDRQRMLVLAGLLLAFMAGAVAGAFGFKSVGYVFTVPLALVLAALAAVPALDDLRRRP
jgi:uncharacterized membrane protein YoaK (UPF0700 family)